MCLINFRITIAKVKKKMITFAITRFETNKN